MIEDFLKAYLITLTLKKICFSILFISSILISRAQEFKDWSTLDRNLNIQLLFPDWKSKALILSFDDGRVEDRKLIKLLNEYQLKGTFHLNSGRLSTEGTVSHQELKTLYKGHELSLHGYNHQGMTHLSDIDYIYEIGEDRRTLEQASGQLIRGLAYPFGSYNTNAFPTMKALGVEYARTVADTEGFDIPDNYLLWHPTIHMFGKAGYMGNKPENDQMEYDRFDRLTEAFLNKESLALYYVWGHSWEYTDKWDRVTAFFQKVSGRKNIFYTTHIELIDYLNAFDRLIISVDKTKYLNNTAVDLYIVVTDYCDLKNPKSEKIFIPAGATAQFKM